MPLDKEQVKNKLKTNEELVEKDHEAAVYARNPSKALGSMAEERDGIGFSAEEVQGYIADKNREALDVMEGGRSNHPAKEDMQEYADGPDTTSYLKENLQEADGIVSVEEDGETYFVDETEL